MSDFEGGDGMKNHRIEIGSFDTVTIEKIFGPTIYCNIRITAKGVEGKWLIEREVINQDKDGNDVVAWEAVCEIDAQESISFRD